MYFPPERAETARQEQQACAAFWDIGRSLAELNRAQLWFAPNIWIRLGSRLLRQRQAEGRKWIVEDFDLLSAIRFRRDSSLKLKD